MSSGVSFDRAADFYDATRSFPPGIAEQVARSVQSVLPPAAHLLEIGVGTGRIARPLLEQGSHLTGVDIAPRMMRRLLESLAPGALAPDLIEADASWLPLSAHHFDAVVCVHVYHLLPEWERVVGEVLRMLKPGGIHLVGYNWRSEDSPFVRIQEQFRRIAKPYGAQGRYPGAPRFENVAQALIDSGAVMDEWSAAEWEETHSVGEAVTAIEQRTWSGTWTVAEDAFPACIAALREWARKEFGSLEREFTLPYKFIWQRFCWKSSRSIHV